MYRAEIASTKKHELKLRAMHWILSTIIYGMNPEQEIKIKTHNTLLHTYDNLWEMICPLIANLSNCT